MSGLLLEVEELNVSYGSIKAVLGVSLEVHSGEAVAILGANGAGKTTLLRALSGLIRPRSGRVRFDGQDTVGMRPAAIMQRGLVHVPEGRQVFSRLTVRENLVTGSLHAKARNSRAETISQVFELFPRLAERKDQLAGTLSGGEQQMLAIGRAIMGRPRLLMLDEPSMGLSPRLTSTIYAALRDIKETVPILLVEQNVRAALSLATRGYLLQSGVIINEGPAKALTDQSIRAAYLGAA